MADKLVFSVGTAEQGMNVVAMLKADGVDESRISVIGRCRTRVNSRMMSYPPVNEAP